MQYKKKSSKIHEVHEAVTAKNTDIKISTEYILNDIQQLAEQLLKDIQNEAHQNILPKINEEQARQIQKYCQLLIKWNDVYNLSALKKINDIYVLHILDCLTPFLNIQNILGASYFSHLSDRRMLDVGSGAGLPGILWAILLQGRPHQITTIDAVQKKIAFQQQVCLELAIPNVKPSHQRIEDTTGGFHFITARAYSSFEKLLNDTKHLRDISQPENGYFLLKGQLNEEIQAAQEKYPGLQIQRLAVPYLNAERHLLYLPFLAL